MVDNSESLDAVKEILQPGKSITLYPNHAISERKIHIRAIVDDNYVVHRRWSPSKKCWHYAIDNLYYFSILYRGKHIKW